MQKICKVRFHDGHLEAIAEDVIELAKNFDLLRGDPVAKEIIKTMALAGILEKTVKGLGSIKPNT